MYVFSGAKDWEFWHDKVPEKLRQLDKDGYRVVLFTNQAGIEKDKVKPQTVKDKCEDIIKNLGITVQVINTEILHLGFIRRCLHRCNFLEMWIIS